MSLWRQKDGLVDPKLRKGVVRIGSKHHMRWGKQEDMMQMVGFLVVSAMVLTTPNTKTEAGRE